MSWYLHVATGFAQHLPKSRYYISLRNLQTKDVSWILIQTTKMHFQRQISMIEHGSGTNIKNIVLQLAQFLLEK